MRLAAESSTADRRKPERRALAGRRARWLAGSMAWWLVPVLGIRLGTTTDLSASRLVLVIFELVMSGRVHPREVLPCVQVALLSAAYARRKRPDTSLLAT